MNTYPYRTYAEIDLDQMRHNLRQVRRMIGEDCRLMFVLKADAYGHGTPVCARYSEDLVDWYAAATIDEALSIRRAGVEKPILLFGMLLDQDIPAAVDARLTVNACSLEYARHVAFILERMGETLDCHIKIDTGTGPDCTPARAVWTGRRRRPGRFWLSRSSIPPASIPIFPAERAAIRRTGSLPKTSMMLFPRWSMSWRNGDIIWAFATVPAPALCCVTRTGRWTWCGWGCWATARA